MRNSNLDRILKQAEHSLPLLRDGSLDPTGSHVFRRIADHLPGAEPWRSFLDLRRRLNIISGCEGSKHGTFGRNVFLLWFDPTLRGIRIDEVKIHTQWDPEDLSVFDRELCDQLQLIPVQQHCQELYDSSLDLQKYIDDAVRKEANRTRLWLKSVHPPEQWTPDFRVEVGVVSYRDARILAEVMKRGSKHRAKGIDIPRPLMNWRKRVRGNPGRDLWTMVVLHAAVLTNDDYLIFRRKSAVTEGPDQRRSDYETGKWSPGIDAQFRPSIARNFEAMLREGMTRDFGVTPNDGSAMRLLAVGREVSALHNSCAFFVVELNESWEEFESRVPREFLDDCRPVFVGKREDRLHLLRLVIDYERRLFDPRTYHPSRFSKELFRVEDVVGGERDSSNADHFLHQTTFSARVLFALAHRFGAEATLEELKEAYETRQSAESSRGNLRRYRIAVSYPFSEAEFTRNLVEAVFQEIPSLDRKAVFFAGFGKSEAPCHGEQLLSVYTERADFVLVVFGSRIESGWQSKEWKAIRTHRLRKKDNRTFLLRLDSKLVPSGISEKKYIFCDVEGRLPAQIAQEFAQWLKNGNKDGA